MTAFRKYLLLSLFIALLNAIILLVFFVPRFIHTDTAEYVSTIKNLAGDSESELIPYRLLKPLPILIGVLLTPFLSAKNTLVAQNVVFYFLSVWLIFLLIYRLYQNEKQAFYATVLYSGAYPMLAYGLAPLTDLPGWFFYLASILIALNLLKTPQLKTTIFSGLIAGFGMLFKESLGAAPIFFATFISLSTQFPFKEKLKHLIFFGLAFLFFPLINDILMRQFFSTSYWDWFTHAWTRSEGQTTFYAITSLRIMIEIARVLLIGWIFVLLGILKEITLKNKERIKLFISLIPPSLSFFLWCYPHNRMMFIAAPLLVLLGSFGLLRNLRKQKVNTVVELSLLFLYIFLNYIALEFFLRYGPILQPPGTLFG